jgi:hypothetical protein
MRKLIAEAGIVNEHICVAMMPWLRRRLLTPVHGEFVVTPQLGSRTVRDNVSASDTI